MAFWVHILIQIQKSKIKQPKNVNFENFHVRWSNPPFRNAHREITVIWTQNLTRSHLMAFWVHILIQIQMSKIKQLKNVNFENVHIRSSNPPFRIAHREITLLWTQNLTRSPLMAFWVHILIRIQMSKIKQLKNVNFENFHIRWSNAPFRTAHREITLIWTQNLTRSRLMAFWVHILIRIQMSKIKQLKNVNFENFHIR